jgi:transposase-like protein
VAKKRRHSIEFRRTAVERLKQCESIGELAAELGVNRRLLYKWRDQLDPLDRGDEPPPENARESALRKENKRLKQALANKTLEVDFFKGALQKVEARRQQSDNSGARASTTKSGK